VQILLLASALVLVAAAVCACRAHPLLLLMGLAYLTLTATDAQPHPLIDVADIAVYGPDVFATVAACAAATRLARVRHNLGRRSLVPVGFLTITSANLYVGWSTYGVAAVNDFRPMFYLLAAVAGVLAFDMQRWRHRLPAYVVWISLALSTVAAYRWSTRGLGSSDELVYIDGTGQTTRALLASQAIVIALGAIISLYRWAETKRRSDLLVAGSLLIVVALLQHRSVWAATLSGITVGVALARPDLRLRMLAAGFTGSVVLASLLSFGVGQTAVSHLEKSASGASLTSGTFKFRTDSWTQLIRSSRDQGRAAVLLGQPFGSSMERSIEGHSVNVSAHNFYVSVYLRGGLIALVLLIALMARWFRRGGPIFHASLGVVLAVYGIAYSVDYLAAPLVGLLLVPPRSAMQEDAPLATSTARLPSPASHAWSASSPGAPSLV